jgi:hypothetical protein
MLSERIRSLVEAFFHASQQNNLTQEEIGMIWMFEGSPETTKIVQTFLGKAYLPEVIHNACLSLVLHNHVMCESPSWSMAAPSMRAILDEQ